MPKRTRDNVVINHKKRHNEGDNEHIEHKKPKNYEYWHHRHMTREERAAIMAAMYIRLIYN